MIGNCGDVGERGFDDEVLVCLLIVPRHRGGELGMENEGSGVGVVVLALLDRDRFYCFE